MENASKALTIAGGILIAVMLAVLVYYVFNHWGDSQRLEQEEVEVQRVSDFNKSYLSYEKVLYGSELLGLANKMSDYNDSNDVKYGGYQAMNLRMTINLLSGSTDNLFNKKGTYNLNGASGITRTIDKVMSDTVNSPNFEGKVSDAQWENLAKSSSRDQDSFNELCQQLNVNTSVDWTKLRNAAQEYYKYVQFKRMKFKHTGTTFFDNGRVESMSFEETK